MPPAPPELVLFDRDGTLIRDVPYNGDPTRVEPMPGAVEAVRRIRELGLRTGVVTNQSGVARGRLTPARVATVNSRVDELFGSFDVWRTCPHGPDEGCRCRKPASGLVLDACAALGVAPEATIVIGDIESDVLAARNAGARGVLVPTPVTRREEVERADLVAATLYGALLLVHPGMDGNGPATAQPVVEAGR